MAQTGIPGKISMSHFGKELHLRYA